MKLKKITLLLIFMLFIVYVIAMDSTNSQNMVSIPVHQNEELTLDAQMVEQKLNMAIDGITITDLPSSGKLMLKEAEVEKYQYIPRRSMQNLKFLPGDSGENVSIRVIPQSAQAVSASVNITVLAEKNAAPVGVNSICSAIPGVMVKGQLNVHDPDSDEMQVDLVEKPRKGVISFDGIYYIYEPYQNSQGKDRFVVRVIDSIGNYSNDITVDITIDDLNEYNGFKYMDMANNPSHYAAIKLYSKGVYAGQYIGGRYVFSPLDKVSGGEYIMMLLAAIGEDPTPAFSTGLPNDSKIPMWIKPYVKTAIDKGIIMPNEIIDFASDLTRAQAVFLCSRAAGINDVKEYPLNIPDAQKIPQWAYKSYVNLAAYRMLDLYTGYAAPNDALTRQYSADLIWQLYKLKRD